MSARAAIGCCPEPIATDENVATPVTGPRTIEGLYAYSVALLRKARLVGLADPKALRCHARSRPPKSSVDERAVSVWLSAFSGPKLANGSRGVGNAAVGVSTTTR